MANHCIDCDFCGKDQRSYGYSCCQESIDNHYKKERQKEEDEKNIEALFKKYGISYPSRSNFISFIKILESMDCKCLKIIAKETKKKHDALEKLRKTCKHVYPDGRSAIIGGFAEAEDWCQICKQ